MSVYSMTGYASNQQPAGQTGDDKSSGCLLSVEIKAVNSRFLDLSLRLPDALRSCELALREKLSQSLKRGKVELRIGIEGGIENTLNGPSTRLLQRLNTIENNIRAWLPNAPVLSVAEVIRLSHEPVPPAQDWQQQALQQVDAALEALILGRQREGAKLAAQLLHISAQLRTLAEQARPLIPLLVAQQQQRFLQRWNEALTAAGSQLDLETAQNRALTEAASFAIRIDVAEELTRLLAHLDEIERLIANGGEIGKRLDFLAQELHREANTLGAKSVTLELSRIALDMKVLIEQLREQVQNIE